MFDKKQAAIYDKQFEKLSSLRDVTHLLMHALFLELPKNARILCIGVGTGAELIYLAEAFKQWQFTAIEPAVPMLDICRQKVEDLGFSSRCTFHEGYVDSLPAAAPFDAATCLLVSHFLTQPDAQECFFHDIATRLRPGGYLVNSALCADMSTPEYDSLIKIWMRLMRYSGISAEQVEKMYAAYGQDVALLSSEAIGTLLTKSGFESPIWFLQTLLIRACYAKRAD